MNFFSLREEGFLRSSLLFLLFFLSLGVSGCEEEEPSGNPAPVERTKPISPVPPKPVEPKPPVTPPVVVTPKPVEPTGPELQTRTFTIDFVRSAISDEGPFNNPNILDVTKTSEVRDHGDTVVFSACNRTGACSDTDTLSFVYYGEDFVVDPELGLSLSQLQYSREEYLALPEDIHLVSMSIGFLFTESILDCEDLSVPLIISARNDVDFNISDDFSDEEKLECVYSSGKVLYVSGWIWDDPGVPTLPGYTFTDCSGFVLHCVRDLGFISRNPDYNNDIPAIGHPNRLLRGTSFAAPRVNMLADWMRRWFDVEDTRTGTLQVFALIRTFAEDLGDPGIDCEWGMGRVDAEAFVGDPNPENLGGGGRLLENYQLKNLRPITHAELSAKLEEKGFTGTFQEQLEKLEWRYRNEANATDSDKEEGYGEVLEFPDCS